MTDGKEALIRARCRKFAKYCRVYKGFAHHVPEDIESLLESSDDSKIVVSTLTQLGLTLHPRGGWESN